MNRLQGITVLVGGLMLVLGAIPGGVVAHEDTNNVPGMVAQGDHNSFWVQALNAGGPLNAVLPGGSSDGGDSVVTGSPTADDRDPHLDRGRYDNSPGAQTSGVSGHYIAEGDGLAINVSDPASLGDPFPVTVSTAGALCDLEVIDGPSTLDEGIVEGAGDIGKFLVNNGTDVNQHDGWWDDGGIGGACHVDYGTAFFEDYSENDCVTGDPDGGHVGNASAQGSAVAHAQDVVSGDWVVILPACDYGSTQNNGPGAALCTVNELIGGQDVDEIENCLAAFFCPGGDFGGATVACLDDYVACVTDVSPTGCDGLGGLLSGPGEASCTNDGFSDASDIGHGGGHGTANGGAAGDGVPFPGPPAEFEGCSGTPVVFVVNAVSVFHGVEDLGGVIPATAGWIDST